MIQVFKGAISAILTFFIYWLGGWDIALQSLLVMIVIDYITGVSKAYVTATLNSSKGLKGIVKKISLLMLVAVATVTDNLAGDTGLIRTLVIYYIVANEGLSILENLGAMGIIVPQFLIDKLEKLKNGEHNEI